MKKLKLRTRIANRLTLNYQDRPDRPAGLYIDGALFPYLIHPSVDFQVDDAAAPSAVVRIFGNAITVIGVNGEVTEKSVSTLEQDETWLAQTVEILQDLGFTVTPPDPDQELAEHLEQKDTDPS